MAIPKNIRQQVYDKCGGHCAYAALIDRVSGKGTWESNPFVVAYEFELID